MNYTENLPQEKKKETKKQQSTPEMIYDIIETLIISTAIVILVFVYLLRLVVVDGPSMMQTLDDGDKLIVSDVLYDPKPGDIIVAQKLNSAWPTPIVKRIIATEGQTVDIDFETWTVKVDGKIIDESEYLYLARDQIMTSNIKYPITVPEGQLFVMGDNRNHSSDSRDYRIGFIDERCVFGHVICRIAPFDKFQIFER